MSGPERLECDALVVGAGPAGAIAAARLAREGLDVLVLEKGHLPRHKICGDFVTPGSVRLLREAGLVDSELAARAVPLRGMRLLLDATRVPLPFPAGEIGWSLGRRDLDLGLARAARRAGARLLEGVRVDSLEECGGRVVARAGGAGTGPLVIGAGVAVDAGGRHAITPARRGWGRTSRWPVRHAVAAWFEGVTDLGDAGEMHVLAGGALGYVGVSPIGPGIAGAAAVVSPRVFRAGARDPADLLRHLIDSSDELRRRFAGARRITGVRGAGPLARGASRYGAGRLLIAGDAAAFVDPFTGEGIHAALVSGTMAAGAAARIHRDPGDAPRAIRAYERGLRSALRPRHALQRALQSVLASPAVARRVASALARREDLAAALIAVTSGCRDPWGLLDPGFMRPLVIETLR
ncbi:MAG TPA: FAD-dependent monooxygenase [Verrucomicrobiae bacterium]|nr:FAD-dependent monooxygenase [Verrucomicrobiae bacterium]